MARINIEDSLYREDGFLNLIAKTQDVYRAKGMILTAFTLAQKHWIKHKSIPNEHWPEELDVLIDVGLAKKCPNGGSVYVKGSEEQFLWLERQSKAGKSKSPNKTKTLKQYAKSEENIRTYAEPTPNPSEALTLTLTPSLTLTQSHTLSKSSSTVAVKDTARVAKAELAKIVRFESEEELFGSIPLQTKDRWLALYEQEYIQRETLKAFNWYENNPRKMPKNLKGWIQALSSWFDRGWSQYVSKIKGQKKSVAEEWLEEQSQGAQK